MVDITMPLISSDEVDLILSRGKEHGELKYIWVILRKGVKKRDIHFVLNFKDVNCIFSF